MNLTEKEKLAISLKYETALSERFQYNKDVSKTFLFICSTIVPAIIVFDNIIYNYKFWVLIVAILSCLLNILCSLISLHNARVIHNKRIDNYEGYLNGTKEPVLDGNILLSEGVVQPSYVSKLEKISYISFFIMILTIMIYAII